MIRCLLLGHVIGGTVVRDGRLRVKCERCGRISPGWPVHEVPPPIVRYAGVLPGRLATRRADSRKWTRKLRLLQGFRVG